MQAQANGNTTALLFSQRKQGSIQDELHGQPVTGDVLSQASRVGWAAWGLTI